MKALGITRKIDDLGRVVLPIELRRSLGISERDSIEIFVEEDAIILKKCNHACVFCGNPEDNVDYKEKRVCSECLSTLKHF